MSTFIHFLRESFRHDFSSVMFFLIAGVVALFFIGYLLIDFIKATLLDLRRKKKHRQERSHQS